MKDANVETALDQPYRCDRRNAQRASAESEPRIEPRTARQISEGQERRYDRQLPRLDTEIEADQRYRERRFSQTEIRQDIRKSQSVDQPKHKSDDPQPLLDQRAKVVQRCDDHRSCDHRLDQSRRQSDEPQHREAQRDRMGYRKRRDDADDVDKRLAEGCDALPSSAAEFEHRGQQQGTQKEYMIKAGPDVPDTGSKKIEKLAPERRRMAFELPGLVFGAENCGMSAALVLQTKQPSVLRIDIEKKRVFDAQTLRDGWTIRGEPHDLVGAVAVVVDQMFDHCNRAAGAIGGNHQSGQCISGDFAVLRLDFPPGDLAVAVGI